MRHELAARAEVRKRDNYDRAWSVWHAEALARMKKLPTFQDFVGSPPTRSKSKKRTWEEMHAAAMAWAMRGKQQ